MRRILLFLTALLLIMLTACQAGTDLPASPDDISPAIVPDTIVYTVGEMNLPLPYASSRNEARGDWTAMFSTADTAIMVQRIDKADADSVITLSDIAKYHRVEMRAANPSKVRWEDDILCFDYKQEPESKQTPVFHYLCVFLESSDAYWMLSFTCEDALYEESLPSFFSWTKGITFTEL